MHEVRCGTDSGKEWNYATGNATISTHLSVTDFTRVRCEVSEVYLIQPRAGVTLGIRVSACCADAVA